jgi:hypothetical protein
MHRVTYVLSHRLPSAQTRPNTHADSKSFHKHRHDESTSFFAFLAGNKLLLGMTWLPYTYHAAI